MIQTFRLTNEPGGLGLSCSPAGLALAGVPLLRTTTTGFEPRSDSEITTLLRAAFGANGGPILSQSRLEAIAQALNNRDFGLAAIAAVQMRIPELSSEAAARIARAEEKLSKYNYDPDEPRDWHGRWTRDGSAGPVNVAALGIERDQKVDAHLSDRPQRVADNASSDAAATSGDADVDDARAPKSLKETFERKYDDLGPTDFAKKVIQFGYWLGEASRTLSSVDRERVLAEYSFLQDRLSFWLAYEYKPVRAQGHLLSAALTLYQGAVNGGIVGPRQWPESMVDVAGTASLFSGGPPRRPSTKPAIDEVPTALEGMPKEMEGLGGVADNSDVGITWNQGIKDQGKPFEDYIKKEDPEVVELEPPPNPKGFDLFKPATKEAISAKTLNTLTVGYIKNPKSIFKKLREYVDAALDYEQHRDSDLDPVANIDSKTIHLAIPEYTNPTQWRYLNRGIIYGKDNGVKVVITRIRE